MPENPKDPGVGPGSHVSMGGERRGDSLANCASRSACSVEGMFVSALGSFLVTSKSLSGPAPEGQSKDAIQDWVHSQHFTLKDLERRV